MNMMTNEEDFQALQETLWLLSIPGILESIEEGRKEELHEYFSELEW